MRTGEGKHVTNKILEWNETYDAILVVNWIDRVKPFWTRPIVVLLSYSVGDMMTNMLEEEVIFRRENSNFYDGKCQV